MFTWKHVAKCSGFVFSHDGGFVCVHTHTDRQAFIHTCVCVCVCVVMCITSLAVSWGVIWRYKSVMDWLIDLTSPKFNGCIPSSIPCLLSPPSFTPINTQIATSPALCLLPLTHSLLRCRTQTSNTHNPRHLIINFVSIVVCIKAAVHVWMYKCLLSSGVEDI